MMVTAVRATRPDRRTTIGALLLGIAMGGFFDGILLHQVLQWHHLLSGLRSEGMQDLRTQVMADGLFHLLMYGLALAGVLMLWTARRAAPPPGTSTLVGQALAGFGLWHVLDAVISHWLLGIHRVRMDSANPLLWDLLWFFTFGVAPILTGLWLRRTSDRRISRGASTTATLLAAFTLLAGGIAALPPRDAATMLVVMRPGADANDLLDGLASLGGGILWMNRSGSVWTVQLDDPAQGARLYRHGALLVTASSAALGCAAWAR